MKRIVVCILCIVSFQAQAADKKKDVWHPTSLKDETVQHIQQAQHQYKKCVADEMQKKGYKKIESRNATDAIIKQCEPMLTTMRAVYVKEGVPEDIADRHLRKMRVQITRRLLKEMMFQEAARSSGVK